MAAHDDNALIEACTAFTELDAEIIAYESAYFDELDAALNSTVPEVRIWAYENLPDDPPPHPRDGELKPMLDRLCATRATTLAGIAARVQALLRWEPGLIEEWQGGGCAERMCAALLRDLRDVLRVEAERDQQALARGKRLARSFVEEEAGRSPPGFW